MLQITFHDQFLLVLVSCLLKQPSLLFTHPVHHLHAHYYITFHWNSSYSFFECLASIFSAFIRQTHHSLHSFTIINQSSLAVIIHSSLSLSALIHHRHSIIIPSSFYHHSIIINHRHHHSPPSFAIIHHHHSSSPSSLAFVIHHHSIITHRNHLPLSSFSIISFWRCLIGIVHWLFYEVLF